MRLERLNHVGIAVPSLEAAMARHRVLFGAVAVGPALELPEHGVCACFVSTGNAEIELIAPLGEASSLIAFLERNPAGGQHHLCYEVADMEAAVEALTARGTRLLAPPRIGAHGTPVAFLHPKDMGGVLTEIMERPDAGHR